MANHDFAEGCSPTKQNSHLHDYLLITLGLTIWVALVWLPCGHDFPFSYMVISDLAQTDRLPPETANHDLVTGSRVTSTSSQATSSNG